jgi:excisionase family DNA binding protein
MKATLEKEDIEAIIEGVVNRLKPVLLGIHNHKDDTILDVKGLSEYLKVKPRWVYQRTSLKEIPYIKFNGTLRFSKKDVDKWLGSLKTPAIYECKSKLRVMK